MRVMILLKANADSEAGKMPSVELLTAMQKYNEELAAAGVIVAGEGLQASSKGARGYFKGKTRTVVDGPFAEAKELIAGFWIFNVQSKQEAIDWVRRCPNPHDGDAEIEIRQIFEDSDFNDVSTPELQAAEARLREQLSRSDARRRQARASRRARRGDQHEAGVAAVRRGSSRSTVTGRPKCAMHPGSGLRPGRRAAGPTDRRAPSGRPTPARRRSAGTGRRGRASGPRRGRRC